MVFEKNGRKRQRRVAWKTNYAIKIIVFWESQTRNIAL